MNTTIMNNRATVLLPLLALASLAAFSQSTGLNYVKETLALDESGSNNIQSVLTRGLSPCACHPSNYYLFAKIGKKNETSKSLGSIY